MLLVVAFTGLSIFLYYKTDYAPWIYLAIATSMITPLGDHNRKSQLRFIFNQSELLKIRLIENILAALPFIIFYLIQLQYLFAISLMIMSLSLAFVSQKPIIPFAIPTPFKKLPFEFIVGFRKGFWVIPIILFLLIKGIQVDNYSLSLFALAISFIFGLSCYFKPENEYYVWVYAMKPAAFIKHKIVTALTSMTILSIPLLGILLLSFPAQMWITISVQVVAYLYLIMIVLAKYSAYPREMNIPQALLISLTIWFPPIIFIIIPLFYRQAIKRLKPILL